MPVQAALPVPHAGAGAAPGGSQRLRAQPDAHHGPGPAEPRQNGLGQPAQPHLQVPAWPVGAGTENAVLKTKPSGTFLYREAPSFIVWTGNVIGMMRMSTNKTRIVNHVKIIHLISYSLWF